MSKRRRSSDAGVSFAGDSQYLFAGSANQFTQKSVKRLCLASHSYFTTKAIPSSSNTCWCYGACMAVGKTDFHLDELAQRWSVLAERRLAYYQELYLSGRWTRYYPTQESFAARLRDAVKAAEAFRKIAAKTTAQPAARNIQQHPAHQTGGRSAA